MDSREVLIDRLTRFYREARGEVSSNPPIWVPAKQRTVRWLQSMLATVALVAVAAGLVLIVRIIHDQAQRNITPPGLVSPAPSSTPSSATPSWVTRRVVLGQVQAMSLDTSAIFALYAPNPVSGPIDARQIRLARVDRTTDAARTAGPFPNAREMARTASGLWLAAGKDQSTTAADTQWLTLVDPMTLKVKQHVRLPGSPDPGIASVPQLSAIGNVMWLGYGHSLYRLDAGTGRISLTQNLPGTATAIAIDPSGQRLYVAVYPPPGTGYAPLIIEWDAVTGSRIASVVTGGEGLGGPQIVATAEGVWIAYATGAMGAVTYVSASGLHQLVETQRQGETLNHVYVGGGALWFVDEVTGAVSCADIRNGTVAASSEETQPAVVVADANGTYLGDANGVGFLRPDPACPH
jgi:hypothetical protein